MIIPSFSFLNRYCTKSKLENITKKNLQINNYLSIEGKEISKLTNSFPL